MDVPAANVVIRFDAVQTPVSLVQSRGRARQADSKFVVLAESEKKERSIAGIYEAEMLQYSKVASNEYDCEMNVEKAKQRREVAQQSRVRNAADFMQNKKSKMAAIAVLKGYASKVNAQFDDEIYHKENDGNWRCDLSMLLPAMANPMQMSRSHASKKEAKTEAAEALLDAVMECCQVRK
eukprot:GHVR01089392.1.p2 GENE.GHVR01089392.1~~GHVR01089392.1.p2  ORF type:complete len:180 (+),score=36.88 GHVR01089392.1:1347-1886(+)